LLENLIEGFRVEGVGLRTYPVLLDTLIEGFRV
jgi:hypothetical protein